MTAAGLWAYDVAGRGTPRPRGGAARPTPAETGWRLDGLERRVRGLEAEVDAAVAAAARSGGPPDARWHAPRARAPVDDAELARWERGLDRLGEERLRQDERQYVERRLGELALDLRAEEHAAAAQVVLEYLRAKAAGWRAFQATFVDPQRAQAWYAELGRTYQRRLREVLPDERQAAGVAAAFIPLR